MSDGDAHASDSDASSDDAADQQARQVRREAKAARKVARAQRRKERQRRRERRAHEQEVRRIACACRIRDVVHVMSCHVMRCSYDVWCMLCDDM